MMNKKQFQWLLFALVYSPIGLFEVYIIETKRVFRELEDIGTILKNQTMTETILIVSAIVISFFAILFVTLTLRG